MLCLLARGVNCALHRVPAAAASGRVWRLLQKSGFKPRPRVLSTAGASIIRLGLGARL